jgi:hypothetical protein
MRVEDSSESHVRRSKSILFVAACIAGWTLLAASGALAACTPGPTLDQVVRNGTDLRPVDAVFIGTVDEIRQAREIEGGVVTPVRFRVEAVLRGHADETVFLMNSGGCLGSLCTATEGSLDFAVSQRWLIVGHPGVAGGFAASDCDPTARISAREARRIAALAPAPTFYPGSEAWTGKEAPSSGSDIGLWIAVAAGVLAGVWITLLFRRRGKLGGRPPAAGPPPTSRL